MKPSFKTAALFASVLCISLFGCGGKTDDKAGKESDASGSTEELNAQIGKAAGSFYAWYIKETKKETAANFEARIVEESDGMCRLDPEPYFHELRNLGTISEKFIAREKERFSACADFVKTVKFAEYEKTDGSIIDDHCSFFSYYNWFHGNEGVDEVEIAKIAVDGNEAVVDLQPYFMDNGKKTPSELFKATMKLSKEGDKWMITNIMINAGQ